MIKFNQVTWYSKLAAIIFFIGVLPALAFYIGSKYQEAKYADKTFPDVVTTNVKTESHYENSKLATYTDQTYGWSFQYPSDWTIDKMPDGSVTVSSMATVPGVARPDSVSPASTITFSTIKKSDFKPFSSKVGDIKYHPQLDALVDGTIDGPEYPRCLPAASHLGQGDSISAFMYAGSNMSDPAYSKSAVLTNRDYMVLISENTYGIPTDQSEWGKTKNGIENIYSTFKLSVGVDAIVPTCTP